MLDRPMRTSDSAVPRAQTLCMFLQAPVAGEVPVMLPEKLQQIRLIAELESLEGGATDLTGDSGAEWLYCGLLAPLAHSTSPATPMLTQLRWSVLAPMGQQHREMDDWLFTPWLCRALGAGVCGWTLCTSALAGAVGRVLVREEDGNSHVQFDLKGAPCWDVPVLQAASSRRIAVARGMYCNVPAELSSNDNSDHKLKLLVEVLLLHLQASCTMPGMRRCRARCAW